MKIQITKFVFFLIGGAIFFYGCSASEVTEEYEGGQKEVVYQTEQPTKDTVSIKQPIVEKTEVSVSTQPEYIPQGPPTPPPPPLKVNLSPEKPNETTEVETQPPTTSTTTSQQYQYKVQVFAFKSRLNAESEAQKIRKRMPDQKVYVEFQDNLYKVRLGIYSKWEHAKGIKDALYNLGYTDSFIITEVKQ
ncbi:MAG: SPOR domain-containing protein [Ignavibacteria bacterium]